MFLYEYETSGQRRNVYSLNKFENECVRKFSKISLTILHDKELNLFDLIEKFKEKSVPILGVNPKVLREFSENYGLKETNLDKIYSACSSIIHNQPPLPFFSLLEVKFFKHFLERYLQFIRLMVEKLINERIELGSSIITRESISKNT